MCAIPARPPDPYDSTLPDPAPTPGLLLAVSFFPRPATTSVRPTRRELGWPELVALLTEHERRSDKDGRGWSPATYAPGETRRNEAVRAISLFVGDRDHQTANDIEEIRARLRQLGLAHIVHSTYSHRPPDDCRFRVVVPFARPLERADDRTQAVFLSQWAAVWRRATNYVLLGENDEQTKDLSRFFFLAAAPSDAEAFAWAGDGEPLDWARIPEIAPARVKRGVAAGNGAGGASRGAVDYLGYGTLDFIAMGAPVGEQRGRALAATRALLSSGKTVEETADLVWRGLEASPCGDPANPWTCEHALEMAQDLAVRPPPPLVVASGPAPAPPNGAAREFSSNDLSIPVGTELRELSGA